MYPLDQLLSVVRERVFVLAEAASPLCPVIDQAAWEGQGWADGRSEQFYKQLTTEAVVRVAQDTRRRAGAPAAFALGFLWGALAELEHQGII